MRPQSVKSTSVLSPMNEGSAPSLGLPCPTDRTFFYSSDFSTFSRSFGWRRPFTPPAEALLQLLPRPAYEQLGRLRWMHYTEVSRAPKFGLPCSHGLIGMQIDVQLRTRHRDAVFPEEPPKLKQNLALDIMDAVVGVSDPEPELKLDRALPERHD